MTKVKQWNPLWLVAIIFAFLLLGAGVLDILHRRNGYTGFPQMLFIVGVSILFSVIGIAWFLLVVTCLDRLSRWWKRTPHEMDHYA